MGENIPKVAGFLQVSCEMIAYLPRQTKEIAFQVIFSQRIELAPENRVYLQI